MFDQIKKLVSLSLAFSFTMLDGCTGITQYVNQIGVTPRKLEPHAAYVSKNGAASRYVWKLVQRIASGKASIIPFPSISRASLVSLPLGR